MSTIIRSCAVALKACSTTKRISRVVGSAGSGTDALRQIPALNVGIVLTDLRMSDMNGDELVAELRRNFPEIGTAMLTNFHSDEEVFRALRAGVRAFLLKTAPMSEVIAAIRAVHAGEQWIPPHIAQQLADQVSRDQLTDREMKILKLLADGYKSAEIAAELDIKEDVLRGNINHLLEKLDSKEPAQAVTRAFRQGLFQVED